MHGALLDAVSHLLAGRFIRARKSAEISLAQDRVLAAGGEARPAAPQVRALAHLVAAEGAQALQDRAGREHHLRLALEQAEGERERQGTVAEAVRIVTVGEVFEAE